MNHTFHRSQKRKQKKNHPGSGPGKDPHTKRNSSLESIGLREEKVEKVYKYACMEVYKNTKRFSDGINEIFKNRKRTTDFTIVDCLLINDYS